MTLKSKNNQIVIGHSLAALVYAYIYDKHILMTDYAPHPEFEHFGINYIHIYERVFGIESGRFNYNRPTEKFDLNVGEMKQKLYNHLCFVLSIAGNNLYSHDEIQSIKVDKRDLIVYHSGANKDKIHVKKVFLFEDEKVQGLPSLIYNKSHGYEVVDWFKDKNTIKAPKRTLINKRDKIVRDIYILENNNIAIKSRFSKKELTDDDFNSTMIKFKFARLMKNKNAKYFVSDDYDAANLEFTRRDVREKRKYKYKSNQIITLKESSEEDVMRLAYKQKNLQFSRLRRLSERLVRQ